MATKKAKQKTSAAKINPLVVVLAISVLLNLYLFFFTSVDCDTTPQVVINMNNKYRELLKDNSEEVAQQKLLEYIKAHPAVKKAEIRNDQEPEPDGIWIEWCGAEGALGTSWENVRDVR